ncbi:MAG: hypothetical protein MZW92_72555 [Comamonadaceae bacterium]|nr:hypothetical protein [Comamonadaceae bacterium]
MARAGEDQAGHRRGKSTGAPIEVLAHPRRRPRSERPRPGPRVPQVRRTHRPGPDQARRHGQGRGGAGDRRRARASHPADRDGRRRSGHRRVRSRPPSSTRWCR